MTKRVAVIGAGPSGLAQLRAFQSAAAQGADIPEIVCFEKQSDWGGLWNYTWRTGLDENGEPVHCSMYRYLWSNGPKEGLEFADYSFEEHFGKPIASYPPRAVLYDYIKGRVEKADVRKWIRFSTPVRHVTYDEGTAQFTVTAYDHTAQTEVIEQFDNVVVASGHFSTPNVPEFEGFDTFNGRVLHAHDFRDALEFKDKNVLIIGTSYSAEDIGSQCWKYGAKSITVSHRTAPMGYDWPDNWKEVPLLQNVSTNTATFKDGSTAEVDVIILCTGYLHHFPFMEEKLRLRTANRLASADLYKGVAFVDNPKLFYLGMQDQWYTFNMFDAQAWYARDIMMGRLDVPDRDARAADVVARVAAEDAGEDDYAAIRYQGDYVKELIAETDYPSFDVDGANEAFFQWKKHKKTNIMTFRDNGYKSVMTGTMAPAHHTPWKDALDDSLESYLLTADAPSGANSGGGNAGGGDTGPGDAGHSDMTGAAAVAAGGAAVGGAAVAAVAATTDVVSDAASAAGDVAQGAIASTTDAIGDVAGTAMDAVGDMAGSTLGGAADVVSGGMDAASGALSGVTEAASDLTSAATDMASGAAASVSDAASGAVSSVTDMASDAASSAVDAASGAASSAADAVSGVVGGASGAVSSATDAASGAADMAQDAAAEAKKKTGGFFKRLFGG